MDGEGGVGARHQSQKNPGQGVRLRRTEEPSDDFAGLDVIDEDAVEWLVLGVKASDMVPFADFGVVGMSCALIAAVEGMTNRSGRK